MESESFTQSHHQRDEELPFGVEEDVMVAEASTVLELHRVIDNVKSASYRHTLMMTYREQPGSMIDDGDTASESGLQRLPENTMYWRSPCYFASEKWLN